MIANEVVTAIQDQLAKSPTRDIQLRMEGLLSWVPLLSKPIPGIDTPFAYVPGRVGAMFALHREDWNLASLDVLYRGRKMWEGNAYSHRSGDALSACLANIAISRRPIPNEQSSDSTLDSESIVTSLKPMCDASTQVLDCNSLDHRGTG